MHVKIGDHAAINELGLHEIAGKLDTIGLGRLARDGKLDLAGKLRVLALLERLDIVPGSAKRSGAPSGSMISLCSTPDLARKSWSRSNRSSCSRSPAR